jgi:hypothetical protein
MRLGVEHLDWLNKQTPSECSLESVGNNVATKEWLVDLALGVQGIKFGARTSISVLRSNAAAFHLLYFCARFPLVLLRK